MMEALSSYETSALKRSTQRNIPEDAILHSHRRENLKSYINYSWLVLFNTLRLSISKIQFSSEGKSRHVSSLSFTIKKNSCVPGLGDCILRSGAGMAMMLIEYSALRCPGNQMYETRDYSRGLDIWTRNYGHIVCASADQNIPHSVDQQQVLPV
jgi:hypothetical protein